MQLTARNGALIPAPVIAADVVDKLKKNKSMGRAKEMMTERQREEFE